VNREDSIVVDASGNSYTTGIFVGRLFVRNNNLTSLSDAIYIIALESTGTPTWAFKILQALDLRVETALV